MFGFCKTLLLSDFNWKEMDQMLASGHGSGISLIVKMFEALGKRILSRYKFVT